MVREQVPLFDALIRNFPAILRRAQSSATPTRSVIKESARKADQASLLPLTYTEGYTKCSESLSRWLFNPSVTLLLYLSLSVVIGKVVEAVQVGFKMSLLDGTISLGDKAQLAKDIAI